MKQDAVDKKDAYGFNYEVPFKCFLVLNHETPNNYGYVQDFFADLMREYDDVKQAIWLTA